VQFFLLLRHFDRMLFHTLAGCVIFHSHADQDHVTYYARSKGSVCTLDAFLVRRACRAFNVLVTVIATVVIGLCYQLADLADMQHQPLYGVLGIVLMLVAAYIGLATQVKRFHDLNMSGWWSLIAAIPFVDIAMLLVIGCMPGDAGANKYGKEWIKLTI
jgi:uncharacterized membrane protein YhaH (DUF805 family)